MADIGSSIVAASIIVGMISIPAASQTVETPETVSENLPNISDIEEMPREVTTETSSDSFERTVESAFQKFSLSTSSDSSETVMEDSGSRLEVERSPEETVWKLETATGDLTLKESSSKTVEKVETSSGTLETVEENGEVTESFEGADRQKVEQKASELRDLMKKHRKEVEERKNSMVRKQMDPSDYSSALQLTVNEETPEAVVIENTFSVPVDLQGWNVSNNNPEYHEFGDITLNEGQELYAYSAEKSEIDVAEKDSAVYVYDIGLTWENTGDTASLWSDSGEKIVEKTYN